MAWWYEHDEACSSWKCEKCGIKGRSEENRATRFHKGLYIVCLKSLISHTFLPYIYATKLQRPLWNITQSTFDSASRNVYHIADHVHPPFFSPLYPRVNAPLSSSQRPFILESTPLSLIIFYPFVVLHTNPFSKVCTLTVPSAIPK